MTVPISSKALLSWEPVKLINSLKLQQPHSVASLELSPADLLFDYYNSVLLVYDGRQAAALVDATVPGPLPTTAEAADAEPVKRLQQALEEMLVHYPCAGGLVVYNDTAGRLEVRYPIACRSNGTNGSSTAHHISTYDDDESPAANTYGVPFHVAHANVSLADLGDMSMPQPSLDVLYPSKPPHCVDGKGHPLPRFVMAFQVTTFKCGGFTLGHTCSHAYADGFTCAAFLQNLCSIARGAGLANPLQSIPWRRAVIRAREPFSPIIPPRYIKSKKYTEPEGKQIHYGISTRYKFSMDALEALRASVSTPGVQSKPCSRNRALMALLWTAFARVSRVVHGLPGSHEMDLRVPMNMRTRGLPVGYMGNALCHLSVVATLEELCEKPVAFVVDKIKKTMDGLDVNECLQSTVDYVELQLRDGMTPFIVGLGMTSLVGLPFYDTDCGWGAPAYVGRPSKQLSNMCIILDHPAVRAWNVLVVFASVEEQACFQETIAKYITS
ncbi:hypothetical protein L7F22_002270 [Adiantum nelumboides]|nr:hypothetical protein [Adiantum nelumboides]